MKKWVCPVCGYVYEGEKPPEQCPICKAPASKFIEQAGELVFADEHRVGIDKGVETLWGVDPSDFEKKRDTAVYQFYMDYLPDSGSERTERSFPCIFKRWNFDQSRPVSVFWNSRKPDWRICDSVQYSASFFCNRNFSFLKAFIKY